MKRYYRLSVQTVNCIRTAWCYKISETSYQVVDKGGDRVNELIILDPRDIISIKPATMNLKYAELELVVK